MCRAASDDYSSKSDLKTLLRDDILAWHSLINGGFGCNCPL